MHGNKWGWYLDWRGTHPSRSVTDSSGPPTGQFRVGRGRSSNHMWSRCYLVARNFDIPECRFDDLGFSMVLGLVPSPPLHR